MLFFIIFEETIPSIPMSKKNYIPFDKFVFRTPLFPLNEADFSNNTQSKEFREALFLASPELYEGNSSSDTKKIKKFELSLLKYFQRARSRCTPFGLFAGCSLGTLGKETNLELSAMKEYQRCTRLDMQYLCALIQKIEHLPDILHQLTYYPNDSLYKIGGKYRYIEYRYQKTKRLHDVVSLEIDDALEVLLKTAANGATYEELVKALRAISSEEITNEEIETYISDVIDSQILKSDLDPCVVGEDILETLIRKLSRLNDVKLLGPLKQIQTLLRTIDSQSPGDSIPLYAEIIDLIKSIGVDYETKYLFQTDMYKPTRMSCIAFSVTNRLAELIDFLTRVTTPGEMSTLTSFTKAFQERYEEQEIPLALAMDRELGIGYPQNSNFSGDLSPLINDINIPLQLNYITEIHQTPLDKVLFRKYFDCIKTGQSIVYLSDDDFKDFAFKHQLADTISVMCSIINSSQIYVSSIGGSCGANILGRFCHLNPGIGKLVKDIADFEQMANTDVIYAEISHLPESRIGNIASRPAFRDHTIHYLSNSARVETDITVSDLMLSVRNGRLFLRSKKYDKEVIPRLTCAHNYSLSPIPVYRFLADMQYQGRTGGLRCGWNAPISDLEYLPRIQYKDFILSRQQWKITKKEVEEFDKLSDDALFVKFQSLLKERHIPEQVIVPDFDNELYLELSDIKCIRLLLSLIIQRKTVVLEEFLFDSDTAIVKQDNNRYTNEVIFAFHKVLNDDSTNLHTR